ncbi:PA2169 family four-helix-bundle protein [Noviherbaspirillum sp. CPCC 100848]|uniref:PA2169 family four-helix-bundle protein n=1 Tax=Noviherbaspirillum album TaxID=3080276 RepID=A0ABU6J5C2_9BURK|nr:PA2169 family four-helix-bundle protein [Noviherbaspirillum sp. CPCC 100848]MEC4718837.1 PA2169 family four-helix-bundle protein [Noviherbaspirillum sp. CPCC 100848]
MNNDDIVSTLNDLIETSKDGEEGFRTCAEDAKDPTLKTFFSNRAQSCAAAVMELQSLVRSYGGDPETTSGLGGALHRRWVDIKSLVTGMDDKAVLKECERGEDVAVSSYRRALDKSLPEEVRSVVERQYQGVLKNHDQVKSLRDQYRSA